MTRRIYLMAFAGAAAIGAACAGSSTTGLRAGPNQGTIAVQMTDAPLVFDSVASVNIFIVRVDARRKDADSTEANDSLEVEHHGNDSEHHDSTTWVTIASPNASVNLLALQNGLTALIGTAAIDSGHFRGLRLVIDPSKSNVTLKNGTVLTTTSNPPIQFFGSGKHGIDVQLDDDLDVRPGTMTTLTIDFKLGESFSMRGLSIGHDGLVFKPSVHSRSHHDG